MWILSTKISIASTEGLSKRKMEQNKGKIKGSALENRNKEGYPIAFQARKKLTE